jgi:soluble lytic murein transglycosylase-like protein
MKKLKLLLVVMPIFGVLFFGFTITHHHTLSGRKMAEMTKSVSVNRHLFDVANDRQATLNKISDIISRYNQQMDENLKSEIADEIYLMSQKYPNLNVDFICATITHESANTWDPKIRSKVGARGLMQVMPATGAFLAVEEGLRFKSAKMLYDPIINIRLGCRYLSDMVDMYDEDGGLAAYNSGPKRAEMWIAANRNNRVLFAETRNYIPAIMKLYQEFQSEEQL